MFKKSCNNRAFTLAEVLITLVIIGVIAAMTIPVVLNITHKIEYRSALKKAFETLNFALSKQRALENITAWECSSDQEVYDLIFSQQLIIAESPESFTSDDCSGYVFRTNDSMIFCIQNFHSDFSSDPLSACDIESNNPCVEGDIPNLYIDVNGEKGPNKLTVSSDNPSDIYQAQIYATRALPYGEAAYEIMYSE